MNSYISNNLYKNPIINSPFGNCHIVYADHTASGQPFKKIEEIIDKRVYPFYANTHSNAYLGRVMSNYVKGSKNIIRSCLNLNENDNVIFTGHGCSGAIAHFVHLLDIKGQDEIPVIFISEIEHNSNFLPWKHSGAELVIVPVNDFGLIDMKIFERILYDYRYKKLKIVSFSAGSNITGIIQDTSAISIMAHKYNCIVAFDYAATAPYVKINMHTNDKQLNYIDAIFISPHKFLGGMGTPGLLIINNKLCKNDCPFYPSGGTVRYTSPDYNYYNPDMEIRETGGTPNIVGCIKTGLVFELKEKIFNYIKDHEQKIVCYVKNYLNKINGLKLLNPRCEDNISQIPIFAFVVPELHYNYVVALLSDLFGIQTRGGVSCSGIYARKILKITEDYERRIVTKLESNENLPKDYGWCRVTFHYSMQQFVIDYILFAIEYVTHFGKYFLHQYKYNKKTNIWNHVDRKLWDTKNNIPYEPLNLDMSLTVNKEYLTEEHTKMYIERAKKLLTSGNIKV